MSFNLSLIFMLVGLTFLVVGYTQQIKPQCTKGTDVRILPRNVYDQIIEDSVI